MLYIGDIVLLVDLEIEFVLLSHVGGLSLFAWVVIDEGPTWGNGVSDGRPGGLYMDTRHDHTHC